MKYSGSRGFTLIELLVVIAVIGILASVVIASLNSARTKGQEASIKSNLRNMIAAAELSYDATGNYSGACVAVQPMMDTIQNITTVAPKCYSYTSAGDTYTRWGVSATNAAKDKNWSVDGAGVVTWDTVNNGSTQNWDNAVAGCAGIGKKMPSFEQLKSLYDTHVTTPPGFTADLYWSGTAVPSGTNTAYRVYLSTGVVGSSAKSGPYNVRCVS